MQDYCRRCLSIIGGSWIDSEVFSMLGVFSASRGRGVSLADRYQMLLLSDVACGCGVVSDGWVGFVRGQFCLVLGQGWL